jgi:nucleoporin NUP159
MEILKANLSKLSTCRPCSLLLDGAAGGRLRPFQSAVRFRALENEIMLIICFIVSWSSKGKQLAIALQSGDIITFSPTETQQAKSFVARPSSMQGQGIIHTTWLSNPAFYAIFSPVGPLDPQADQKHVVIVHDTKRSDASADIAIPINFFPSGVRPPGAFTITLKGWDPAKILLLVGDSTTADIGLVCCTAEDKWQKLSFDEGAPSMPLDADQNETTMIGFELDLKNTTPYDVTTSTGETISVPPPPVVWAYASDGTVVAWYVVNTRGTPYPSKGQAAVRSPVVVPAATVPSSSPFSPTSQPSFGQSAQSTFGVPTFSGQPASSFGMSTPSFGQSGFGQTSTTGPAFGQAPAFGNSAFGAASSTFGQASPPAQAPSGGAFAAFASSPIKWGQTGFGSAPAGFAAPAPPPQIQPAESTESMATDSSQELSFGAMSLSNSTDNVQAKEGPGTTGIFGAPAPPSQSAPSQATTTAFGSGSFALSPGVGAFSKFAAKPADDTTGPANVEIPKPSPAFGQTSFAPGFGQSGFGQPSFGQSAFGKTGGLGTPMSTTPIATPINPTSSSTFGSGGGAFGAFASGGPTAFGGAKPAETKPAAATSSSGGAFSAFASGGPSAFGQAASNKQDSVPAWKTGGDIINSGTGTTVFGGTPSAPPATTPVKTMSMFTSTEPTTTPTATPPGGAASPEKGKSPSPFTGAASSTTPTTTPTPAPKSQSPSAPSTTPTASPPVAGDSAKPPAPIASTTPVGTPPAANAFAGLRMSSGFGLSNFNAKDSPFSNPKPVAQTVSAFGDQSSAPKGPVPATPGSVFGQTSVIGTPPKPSSGFAQPAFGSPPTPSASPNATPSTSKTPSSNAFSAFSGSASAFGKPAGSGVAFSDMLRAGGSSPENSKSKEPSKTPGSPFGPTPATPKSAFEASPTPQPAKIPALHDSDDEEEEKDKGQTVSAGSSFSNISSSSSFVDISRGGEEDEEADSEHGEQQIDEFLSDTYSEGDSDRERDQVEDEEGDEDKQEAQDGDDGDEDHAGDEEHEGSGDADDEVPPSDDEDVDPTSVPLPASRSPSSTPKFERPSINVQPTDPSPKASLPERARTTTPPGSPSKETLSLQTPLQQPTPTLPSPSLSPSPASAVSFGRPNTRPLRSSPLANTPVSGGEEEEVKGEKPASLKPHPASPRPPFGQWDGSALPPLPPLTEGKPTPAEPAVEPLVDQSAKATPSAIARPKTPPLLIAKGTALNNTSATASAVPVAPPVPTLNLGGFSLGTAAKPDTKPPAEDATTKPATTPAANLFAGLKPGAFSLMPKPEPVAGLPLALDAKAAPTPGSSLFGSSTLGATTKLPPLPVVASPFSLKPVAATAPVPATGGKSAMSAPARVATAPPLVTPPKDATSGEPLNPIQIEFTNLITEIGTELANVSTLSVLALFFAHVALIAWQAFA